LSLPSRSIEFGASAACQFSTRLTVCAYARADWHWSVKRSH
jgi:hypothetical protein